MIPLTRRTTLGAGISGVMSVPFLATGAAAGAEALYSRHRFVPLLGTRFAVVAATGRWTMTLREVGDLAHAPSGDDGCFTLTFRSGITGPAQGSCTVRRSGFAQTALFLVPTDDTHRTYAAVVNRV